jgi:predicted acetyltransferase
MCLFSHFEPVLWVYAAKPMPDILVRPAEERDSDGMHEVWSLTYNNGDPYPPERRNSTLKGSMNFVAECDGRIAAACNVLDLEVSRGAGALACGGVAAVAVLPEMRRSGVGTAMMSWLISHLREIGVPLASLYAFREPYYRRFGYEVAGKRLKIVCPVTRWPKFKSELPVRRLTPQDWQQLVPCYQAFARHRSGVVLRTEPQWQRVLGENRPLTIYAAGDPVEAYAVVSHVTNFWTTDHISEIAWSSRSGYESVLAMLGSMAINKSGLSWFEPSDGLFYADYVDQGVDVILDRPIMFRVNDVAESLRLLRPEPDVAGAFIMGVEDALIRGNHGPWAVSFSEGKVEVEKASGAPDFTLDVRHFAQAFLGEPGISQLAAAGVISANSKSGLAAACRLMQPQATYCMDFF